VLPFLNRPNPDLTLRLSVLALSNAVLGRTRKLFRATEMAKSFYAEALARLQTSLGGGPIENLDEVLLSMMLMAYYEVRDLHHPFPAIMSCNMLKLFAERHVGSECIQSSGPFLSSRCRGNTAVEKCVPSQRRFGSTEAPPTRESACEPNTRQSC
jgi:hypothetical protein